RQGVVVESIVAVPRGIRRDEHHERDRRQRVLRSEHQRARPPGHRIRPYRRQRHPRGLLVPGGTPQTIRQQVKQGKPQPIYLIVGDDEAEMSRLTAELSTLVEDELRAFNLERMYAGERGVSP